MKRRLLMFLMMLALMAFAGRLARGQSSSAGSITAAGATCYTTNACITLHFPTSSYLLPASASIAVSGTFVATLQFEQSGNNGVTWVAATGSPQPAGGGVTLATAAGLWTFNVGSLTDLRVRASAYTSGTAAIVINSSPSGGISGAFANGTGTGYQDIPEIATPANPAVGYDRLYVSSITGYLTCLTAGGANCVGAGTVTGTGVANEVAYFTAAQAIASDAGLTYDPATGLIIGGTGLGNITPAALPGAPVAGDFGILAGSPDTFWFFNDTAVRYVIATTNGKMRVFHSFEGVCQDTTASFPFDLAATAVPSAACITGTNTLRRAVLDFDADTDELVEASIWLSDDWTATGGVDVDVEWQAAATTGYTVWAIQTSCVADAEAFDPAWNTASTVKDAAKGTTNQRNIASMTGVDVTGCAANERMFFHFWRDADDGTNDTMAGDARLTALRFKTRWTP